MIRVLTRYMRLYKAFFFQCLKEDMIYRSNFLTLVIMDIGFVCVSIILFKVIYGHVNTIAGWTFNQSVILIGTVGIVREMAYLTFRRGFLELGNHIRTGTFDMFMVRPIASGIHLGMRHLSISESFGEGMMGLALVIYGFIHVDTWSWIVFPLYILFLLNSLMIYYGFSPFIIPIGIIATVPASALTGRLGFNFAILSLVIGISFLCVGLFVWKMSIEHYSSASG